MEKFEKSLIYAKKTVLGYLPNISGLKTEIIFEPNKTIPEIGIGGSYKKNKNQISIYLNSEHKNIKENFDKEILQTFSHEYAHAVREQKIPWENCTLLEAFITEGLAQSFEFEVSSKKPIYALSLSQKEIDTYWEMAFLEINRTDFDYSKWFFGSDKKIKKWAGYALGFWLVQNYCKKNNKKSNEIIHLDSIGFLPELEKVSFVNEQEIREKIVNLFQTEKEKLQKLLPNSNIEHVGGTSVPNSMTKGDLDINIRVSEENFNDSIECLKKIYQINQPNNWTDGFASFKDDNIDLGVQLTVNDSADDLFVKQRDFLKSHPGKVLELNKVKLFFEGKSMDEYRKAKGEFFKNLKS